MAFLFDVETGSAGKSVCGFARITDFVSGRVDQGFTPAFGAMYHKMRGQVVQRRTGIRKTPVVFHKSLRFLISDSTFCSVRYNPDT